MNDTASQNKPPLYIVANTHSGPHRQQALEVKQALLQSGRRFEFVPLQQPGQLTQAAKKASALAKEHQGIVVAAGGDGTINAVAQVAFDDDVPLGVVPMGTFNYFSRTHLIPQEIAQAVDTLLTCAPHPIQVGLVNDHLFLVNASLGLYPKILEDREAFEHLYGRERWVAILAAAITLFRERWQVSLRIENDGEEKIVHTATLFVGNNYLQLQKVGISEAAALQERQLVALSVKPAGRWRMLNLVLRGALGRLGAADNVNSFSFRELEVEPFPRTSKKLKLKVATDGETFWLRAPLLFRVAPKPLWLIRPAPEQPPSA